MQSNPTWSLGGCVDKWPTAIRQLALSLVILIANTTVSMAMTPPKPIEECHYQPSPTQSLEPISLQTLEQGWRVYGPFTDQSSVIIGTIPVSQFNGQLPSLMAVLLTELDDENIASIEFSINTRCLVAILSY